MRRTWWIVGVLAALAASSCGGGSDGTQRTVLVDFSSDEFASSAFLNVPGKVTVTPGATIVFRQTWTGEPHTVTGGTSVNEPLTKGAGWLTFFEAFEGLAAAGADVPDPTVVKTDVMWPDIVTEIRGAGDAGERFIESYQALIASGVALPPIDNPPAIKWTEVGQKVDELSESAFSSILFAFDDESDNIAQNVGQPCYLGQGMPPEEGDKPCPKADQRQPEFNGKQSFYNSGIIRYEGNSGNTFKVKLTDDIEPGSYMFYCAVHGPQQLTEVEVLEAGSDIPSQGDVARETREATEKTNSALRRIYREARDDNRFEVDGEPVTGPFSGLYSPQQSHALINEFIPKELSVKTGEPITWKMFGADHTISFGVPRYFPIIEFLSSGVRINPKLGEPAGGAPPIPEQDGEGIFKIDGGTYSGSGFWSSGLVGAEPYAEYTVRIAKAGTYNYACLIHPPMVGKITVT